jgi:formimidoylglutamate deiminase
MTTLLPELVYLDGAFRPGLALTLDEGSGRITAITAAADARDARDARPLPGRALMPGFVNAHSHAFQRLIRGRTQWRPADDGASDFWSWRDAMYRGVLALSPEELETVSRFCFVEMLRAGITAVGEFHYVHNDGGGQPFADRAELARRVIAAAESVGMRIALLNVCYARGGIRQPLAEEQRRFATPELDAFLRVTGGLADAMAGRPLVSVGVAPHSVRAVPREWLGPLHELAASRDMPLHMHVSEQPAEVDACVAAFGRRPVELLHDAGLLDHRFTAVHATHISDREVALLAGSGATVCACPGTERDLGDGILRAAELLAAGGRIALGTDSQTIIDMLEEMRLVEYHERLRTLRRVVLPPSPDGRGGAAGQGRREPAPALIAMATEAGARSLRLPAGALAEGLAADLTAIDLHHRTLAGWTEATLPAMLALSGTAELVTDVWVAGRNVVRARHHEREEQAMEQFREVARRISGEAAS